MNGNNPTPQKPENRPGLPQIAYRISDYAAFRQRLLDLLATIQPLQDGFTSERPLAKLTTRLDADPAIALLDAWAVVADVLTFYQERIANEGYLRTATERLSVLELARAIGYKLNPGVAASTYVVFTVEDTPNSLGVATISQGTQIMSVPQKDELPQTFETSTEFIAYAEWNAIKPRLSRPQEIKGDTCQLYLQGINTQLQAGDKVLLIDNVPDMKEYLLTLTNVQVVTSAGYTLIYWQQSLPIIATPLRNPQIFAFRQQAKLFGNNAPRWEDMPAEVKLAAVTAKGGSIQGGIFRSGDNGSTWASVSQGLPNADITCLTTKDGVLLAGTPGRGIFRSLDNGKTWDSANNGLTNLNIQTLYTSQNEHEPVFAGTPNGGVFRSKDGGENWVPINTGTIRVEGQNGTNWQSINTSLPNTVVRSLLAYSTTTSNLLGTGRIASNGLTVSGYGTEFTRELKVGDTIAVAGETKRIEQIDSDTSLRIDTAFISTNLNSGTAYVATTFQVPALLEQQVTSIIRDEGTISSQGTTVTGVGTQFSQLRTGNTHIRITALGQTKTVVEVISDTSLRIDSAFTQPSLDAGTSFSLTTPTQRSYIFAGTDDGLYRSQNQGHDWITSNLTDRVVYALYYDGTNVFAGTDAGVFSSSNHGQSWSSKNLEQRIVFTLVGNANFLFAGTDTGVFRFSNQGQTWQAIQAVLNDNNTVESNALSTCIVHSLVTYEQGENSYLFAGTNKGIFVSTNSNAAMYNTVQWRRVSQNLPTQDITVLAYYDTAKELFAGSRFAGFTAAEVKPVTPVTTGETQRVEWPHFQFQDPKQIDLDTLYPQILPGSWIVLFDERHPQNPEIQTLPRFASRQVENVATILRRDFGLSTKITRIEPSLALVPENFGLRSTEVLVRSEELALFEEPLTVSTRALKIFQDPIYAQTIFLNNFVQRLQPNQTIIVSGRRIRLQLNDVGGVFRANNRNSSESIVWERSNNGLTNSQIQALVFNAQRTLLIAGTTEGIFQSTDNGKNWEPMIGWRPINETLEQKDIKVLFIKLSFQSDFIFVGTAQGIFRSSDSYKWEKVIGGLDYTNVKTIACINEDLLVGTISGGLFRSSDNGNSWIPTGLNNTDVQTIAVQEECIFAGTIRDGIFRSDNGGITWQQFTETRPGLGAISSDGAVVTGNGTTFSSQLKPGDIITATEQTRTIIAVDTDGKITVDIPFRPDISQSTFTINTGLTNRNITALVAGTQTGLIFAGTSGSGVFRSQDNGQRWEQINVNLTDLKIRCLTVGPNNEEVWVGTASGGVFHSDNNGGVWTAVNNNLTNTDVRAILVSASTDIFVGGIGILHTPGDLATKPVQRGDIFQVLTPPTTMSDTNKNVHQWQLADKDNFVGDLTTTAPSDLTLLPAVQDSEIISEVAIIQAPPTDQQLPVLTLQQPLKYSYDPATVSIYANVVQATQGQTVEEVLGSGDGNAINQQFTLKKPPLTYIPTATASGAQSTLEVRINGVLWQEVPALYPLTTQDQDYIIHIEDDGTTKVTFGDGIKGTRLPSGQENITATYRSGIGLGGNVSSGRLSLLKTRPLGIVNVTNPLPASGAADSETLESVRANAPPTVRTLSRIVSLSDFEDFVGGFAGIDKAKAVALWSGETQIVHITIAAALGDAVTADSNLYIKLIQAIDTARDPTQQVQVDSYERLLFNIEARLLIDPRYEAKVVEEKVRNVLETTFAFSVRDFGQEVTAAAVIAVIQKIEGVIAVDLDALYQINRSKALEQSLIALLARYDPQTNQVYPAQLLLLNSSGITLTIVPTL